MMTEKQKNLLFEFLIILSYLLIPILIYQNPLFQSKLMVSGDGIITFTAKLFQYRSLLSGELPLWNSYVGIGAPFFADLTNTFFYPINILAFFTSPTTFSNLFYLIHLTIAGIFSYLYLKEVGINRLVAFLGGLVFLASVILGTRREHVTVYSAIVWFPLILFFIQKYVSTGKIHYLCGSALVMAIQLFGGHTQWVFYTDIFAFIYFVYCLLPIQEPWIKKTFKIFIWGVFYLLFSAIAIIPQIELFLQSARGSANYFSLFSTKWPIFLMTVFPGIFGELAQPLGDFASAEISIELYLGIIPLIYALYAIRYYHNNRLIRFSTIAAVFALFYSSISNIPILGNVVRQIPIINFFGVQSRILFIYIFFGIVCFAFGISDVVEGKHLKRLFTHNLQMASIFLFMAIIISAITNSPILSSNIPAYYKINSSTFWSSIGIAAINVILIGLLGLIQKHKFHFLLISNTVVTIMVILTIIDVGRFSFHPVEVNYDDLLVTEETTTLRRLLQADPYRIVTSYDQIYGGDYYASGLVDNWSMLNEIRNLKGFNEYENTSLNKLLHQVESRDSSQIPYFLAENSILSMLSVKYILYPIGKTLPIALLDSKSTSLIDMKSAIEIPGDGSLFVDATQVSIETNNFYQIEFTVDAPDSDVSLFYVDFYGGTNYDNALQNQEFNINKGINSYKTVIYSGDVPVAEKETSFRVVSIANTPLQLTDLKVRRLFSNDKENPYYQLVAQTRRYNIYENKNVEPILYIPNQVRSTDNVTDLLENPINYSSLNQISYVKGMIDTNVDGVINIFTVTNNRLEARVNSQNGTFVNHSQRFYPGWKAFIDGKLTQIHLVNGLIQGIEVPAGEHLVEFTYDPLSLKIGALMSFLGILLSCFYLIIEAKNRSRIEM